MELQRRAQLPRHLLGGRRAVELRRRPEPRLVRDLARLRQPRQGLRLPPPAERARPEPHRAPLLPHQRGPADQLPRDEFAQHQPLARLPPQRRHLPLPAPVLPPQRHRCRETARPLLHQRQPQLRRRHRHQEHRPGHLQYRPQPAHDPHRTALPKRPERNRQRRLRLLLRRPPRDG